MLGKSRFTMITATILMVLALSAMWAGPAFADDSAPPPPVETPTEVAPPPAEDPASAPEEVSPPAEETSPLAEVLEQLPENTEVKVVNTDGDLLPLATEEAAQAIVNGDPMWCPVGVVPGAVTCSQSYTTFNQDNANVGETALLGWLLANPKSVAGVIWVQAGYDGSLETGNVIQLNGGSLVSMHNFALTIQGGWSGLANKTINTLTPSIIQQRLVITGWNGDITLNDLLFAPTISDGSTYNALSISTTKNILLERVTVQDADNTNIAGTFNGAFLDNTSGVGNVTINNSNFQGNEGYGLLVNSKGIITTNNLTANLNGGTGAQLDNTFATTDKAVTMKGLKQFNSNGDWGLKINSDGAVTLSNVVANQNDQGGVFVDNRTSLTKLGVTISGSNYFLANTGGDGLTVFSLGTITAANLNASDNGANGATLDNCNDFDSDFDCDLVLAKAVTLTGFNNFNGNADNGLEIYSYGNIAFSNVVASNNGIDGAHIDNQFMNIAVPTPKESVGTWTLNGYGTFSGNGGDGLEGYSNGAMVLNTVTANDNGTAPTDVGAYLSVDKTVGSASVTFKGNNTFNDNKTGDGLYIDADGKVTLSNVTAINNPGYGATIITHDLASGVTLSGVNTFIYNGQTGLYIDTPGAIALNSITASYNGSNGAYLSNLNLLLDPAKAYNITLTGSNYFNSNGDMGLEAYSYGTMLLNNLNANDNGLNSSAGLGYGAYLDNCIFGLVACTALPKTVTLNGFTNTSNNFDSGLRVDSNGAVTLNNVTADGNAGISGAEIYNAFNAAKPQNVTLKGNNTFNYNGSDGLLVSTYGAIALNNVTANFNGGNGATLDNSQGTTYLSARTIILTGVNTFIGNYFDGLSFDSSGSVTLNRINADWNTDLAALPAYAGSGVVGTAHTGSITLVCGHFLGNEGRGYDLTALAGPIFIKGYYSYANGISPDIADGTAETITKVCALP